MAIVNLEFDRDGDLVLVLGRSAEASLENVKPIEGIDPKLAISAYEQAVGQLAIVTIDQHKVNEYESNKVSPTGNEEASSSVLVRPVQETHMLVSNKMLIMASPVFRAMLKGHFKEGKELRLGRAEVVLEDDPPAAFRILMDIVHFRSRQVPRSVDIKTLVELAVLADKYQAVESVEVFASRWLQNLQIPTQEKRSDLWPSSNYFPIGWARAYLCVSWVFRSVEPKYLKLVTREIILFDEGDLNVATTWCILDLPLPVHILEHVDNYRQEHIARALGYLNDFISEYLSVDKNGKTVGSKDYIKERSKRLKARGHVCPSLLTSLVNYGLWPLPTAPYEGYSIRSTLDSITSAQKSGSHFNAWNIPVSKSWMSRKWRRYTGPTRLKLFERDMAAYAAWTESRRSLDNPWIDSFCFGCQSNRSIYDVA